MSRYRITTHTTAYGPWGEEMDEPPKLGTESEDHEFDTLREVADYLESEGLSQPSQDPGPYNLHTWMTLPDGSRPHGSHGNYTGETEEMSAHQADGFTERTWNAVLRVVVGK
jgi:hypothetical protein